VSRFLRLTRAQPGVLDPVGLERLRLALWDGGREVAHVEAISGARGRQVFRSLSNEVRGQLEPIPEGRYHQVGGLEWAGKPGDYSARWSEALGPVVVELYGERAIMLHIDGGATGSAGCVCPRNWADLRIVVGWFEAGKPEWLEVDWGDVPGGKVGKPAIKKPDPLHRVKLFARPGKAVAYRDGVSQDALNALLEYKAGKLALTINGAKLPLDQIESVAVEVAYKAK
jgi:hypothetical protein